MKIIGTVGDGLLCQMSASEIYKITGNEDFRYNGRYYRDLLRAIGAKIDVDIRWSKMIAMEQNRQELEKALKTIRAVADVLEPCLPNIELPPAPDAIQQIGQMASQTNQEIAS